MIKTLTEEQNARFPEFVKKWTEIGMSTQPADKARAEKGIKGLYKLAKLREPKIIWRPCPISAALSVISYASIMQTSGVHLAVHSAVRSAVHSAVRSSVHSAVGSAVDSAVDSAVRSAVRSAGYLAVDLAVGLAVHSSVRSSVHSAVDQTSLRVAGNSFFGGSLWAGYPSWMDYMAEVLEVNFDTSYVEVAQTCGFYWTLDGVCFASERPSSINLDDRGRLHSVNSQSIGYRSGWGLYHFHGVQIPEYVIMRPEEITVANISEESNQEIRRVMIEKYGQERYLKASGAKKIHEDDWGTLWKTEIPNDEPLVMVEVLNSTQEPDGTFKTYFIRVSPKCTTARGAIAWSFGKTEEEYAPLVQT